MIVKVGSDARSAVEVDASAPNSGSKDKKKTKSATGGVVSVQLFAADSFRKNALIFIAVAMYAIAAKYYGDTMGAPRARAIEERRLKYGDDWALVHDADDEGAWTSSSPEEDLKKFGGQSTASLAQLREDDDYEDDEEGKLGDFGSQRQNDDDERDEFSFEEEAVQAEPEIGLAQESDSSDNEEAPSDDPIEALAAKVNKTKRNATLPGEYLPDAGAVALTFSLVTLHILFHLMCYWYPSFLAKALHRPLSQRDVDRILRGASPSACAGGFALVTPLPHCGKAALVPLVWSAFDGGKISFLFQRRKFVYSADTNTVSPVRCPFDAPVRTYKLRGLDADEAAVTLEKFGKNSLEVARPNFKTILKEQLLSPIVMFQFFCAALWLLDEYWQYSVYSLFSIIAMESGTSFQRLKTVKALDGLSTKPKDVHVYRRSKGWVLISSTDILPGDIIALTSAERDRDTSKASKQPQATAGIVPCDCLILRGSAVVNEATLTGESVPQMKDNLDANKSKGDEGERPLDVNGADRVHVLFSGTCLVSASDRTAMASSASGIPPAPNGGCVCVVLRTGFHSSQGELMQMIEYSTRAVSADVKETMAALGLLLCFAIAASSYVLKKGLEKGDQTTHQLMLKCVIIITSVVPQQLPVQMAIAVNQALMALMKAGLFCIEPFKVPIAGKISHVLFDKTGTITTDVASVVGILEKGSTAGKAQLCDMFTSSPELTMVCSACHSLMSVSAPNGGSPSAAINDKAKKKINEGLLGDPIEIAALNGVAWSYDHRSQVCKPQTGREDLEAAAQLETKLKQSQAVSSQGTAAAKDKNAPPALSKTGIELLKAKIAKLRARAAAIARRQKTSWVESVRIVERYRFSSKLQRMSVVARTSASSADHAGYYALTKGSPEAVRMLLSSDKIPSWYDASYRQLAEQGLRVLAMAYKKLPSIASDSDVSKLARDDVESELSFAGFIAFECKIRADSKIVIASLQESSHEVYMATGDAPLTATHVARQVGIAPSGKALILTQSPLRWVPSPAPADGATVSIPFDDGNLAALTSQGYDLVVTEKALLEAVDATKGDVWNSIDHVHVFARMSPDGKTMVIREMQERMGHHVFMCGDGGNDVGALKQADVGLALLSGYGETNTSEDTEVAAEKGVSAEDQLNNKAKQLASRARVAQKMKKAEFNKRKAEIVKMQQQWLQEELKAMGERGEDTGFMGTMRAMKKTMGRMQTELKKEGARINRKHGNVFSDKENALLAALDSGESEDMPVIRPGDASVAAPFTSRMPSISSCVKLLRQGRCTLLSALQQQQIMMLECIISAYCLSALSLDGARSSERQMMASSWLIMTASVAFSFSSSVDKMHRVRPLRSLFHPAVFLSILGQAAIHLGCMIYAVQIAKAAMGEEKLAEVMEFNKMVKAGEEIDLKSTITRILWKNFGHVEQTVFA